MKIFLIGNYKSNNGGDDLYRYLLEKQYLEHRFYVGTEIDLFKCDFIIYGGGGILSDQQAPRVELMNTAISKGIPTAVISVGSVGGIRKLKFIELFEKVIRRAKIFTVRDRYAFDEIHKIRSSVKLLPDLAWSFKPDTSGYYIRNKFTLGVMIRRSSKHNKTLLIQKTADTINRVNQKVSVKVIFFSTYGEKLIGHTLVKEITEKIARSVEIEFVPPHTTTNLVEHLSTYNRCDYVIAMPYHGILLSILYKKPVIGWSYELKIKDLAESLKIYMEDDVKEDECLSTIILGNYLGNIKLNPDFVNWDIKQVSENVERVKIHYKLLDKYLK